MRLALAAFALAFGSPARLFGQTSGGIDSMRLRAHTWFLSHDLLEGRGTGRRGADVAALYVATEAERIGLRGAGPAGSPYQPVPLLEAEIDRTNTSITLRVPDRDSSSAIVFQFFYPRGFIPNVGTARTLTGFSGDLVYVGSARDILVHPDRLPDLTGKVAVMRGVFGPEAAAADTLRAGGTTGVVQLLGDPELYGLYVRSRGPSRMYIAEEAQAVSSFIPDIPAVIASPQLEQRLLEGTDVAAEADRPRALPGRRIDVRIAVRASAVAARNVAAIMPGSDSTQRDAFVVYTAHYDHLGVSTPDERGDSIYNGFSDNASGTAMLLGIAEALVTGRRPPRPVLFLWFTGEERGLLGSDYFAAHPLVPAAEIVGAINLDAGAPPAPVVSWHVAGGDRSSLGQLAVDVSRRAGWAAEVRPASPNSDYFPLLRIGVPAVFLVPSPGPYEGLTTEASDVLRRRWDHYHQASDHWAADFPFAGLLRYADYAYRIGWALETGARPRLFPWK
ncbi:MAG: M28 family peptidase [Gemmatimonadales bacterium]|nr:M28 family peptidase [Gemmatimonadales bacterium]